MEIIHDCLRFIMQQSLCRWMRVGIFIWTKFVRTRERRQRRGRAGQSLDPAGLGLKEKIKG